MTGGSSGFGAVAAGRLTGSGAKLLVGARSGAGAAPKSRRGSSAGEKFRPLSPSPSENPATLELTSLESVRTFASEVRAHLDGRAIDGLLLNAGLIKQDDAGRTLDGFEITFAVNHLAHYLLLRLLLPDLADGATVVLTSSGTHDPATGAGLATPRHADATLLAHPDQDEGRDSDPKKAGEHAYTASKLCAVLTARHLVRLPEPRHLNVIAYDPGQVFGTGLARDLSAPLRLAWSVLGTPAGAPLRWFKHDLNTRTSAGHALADLALDEVTPPPGRTYAALRRGRLDWPDPSDLGRRDDLAEKLWDDSARLVGVA